MCLLEKYCLLKLQSNFCILCSQWGSGSWVSFALKTNLMVHNNTCTMYMYIVQYVVHNIITLASFIPVTQQFRSCLVGTQT